MRRYTLDTRKYVAKTNNEFRFRLSISFLQKNVSVSESIVLRFLVAYLGEGM